MQEEKIPEASDIGSFLIERKPVGELIMQRLGRLGMRDCRTKEPTIKSEIDRLNGELAKLPAEWLFASRRNL